MVTVRQRTIEPAEPDDVGVRAGKPQQGRIGPTQRQRDHDRRQRGVEHRLPEPKITAGVGDLLTAQKTCHDIDELAQTSDPFGGSGPFPPARGPLPGGVPGTDTQARPAAGDDRETGRVRGDVERLPHPSVDHIAAQRHSTGHPRRSGKRDPGRQHPTRMIGYEERGKPERLDPAGQ